MQALLARRSVVTPETTTQPAFSALPAPRQGNHVLEKLQSWRNRLIRTLAVLPIRLWPSGLRLVMGGSRLGFTCLTRTA